MLIISYTYHTISKKNKSRSQFFKSTCISDDLNDVALTVALTFERRFCKITRDSKSFRSSTKNMKFFCSNFGFNFNTEEVKEPVQPSVFLFSFICLQK